MPREQRSPGTGLGLEKLVLVTGEGADGCCWPGPAPASQGPEVEGGVSGVQVPALEPVADGLQAEGEARGQERRGCQRGKGQGRSPEEGERTDSVWVVFPCWLAGNAV